MIWKKIDDYDYSINENGDVRNDKTGRILKVIINTRGYLTVGLYKNGVPKIKKIHRLLARYFLPDFSEDLVVDHINRVKTDNSLENLRMVTFQQNSCNQTKRKNGSSIYKGVFFNKGNGKWRCQIRINDKIKQIGYFNTELEAGKAYNQYINDNNLIYHPKNDI